MLARLFGGVPASSLARRLLALAILLYLLQAFLYLTWFIDDAGISFTYARNLAHGDGLVLFPGGERVEAYSNPLWVFLLAPFLVIGLDVFVMAKLLSLVAGVAILIGITRLADALTASEGEGLEPGIGASSGIPVGPIAALLTAINPPFVIWTTGGLEGGLYTALLVWAVYRLLEEYRAPEGARARPWSALLFLGVALTRPEGIMFFGVGVALRAFWDRAAIRSNPLEAGRRWAPWLAAFAVPWLLYQLWHYRYFATFVTNTFHVKKPEVPLLERLLNHNSGGWNYIYHYLNTYRLLYLSPLVFVPLLERAGARVRGWWLVFGVLLAAAFFPVYSDGDWMKEWRFMAPVAPFFCLMLVGGAAAIADRLPEKALEADGGRPSLLALLLAVTGLYLLVPAMSNALDFAARPETSVEDVRARAEFFRSAREKLGLTGDVSWLDPDLGGTSYYSGMRIVDTWGLADVPIARQGFNQAFVGPYIFTEVRPQFAHVFGYWNSRVHILEEARWNTEFVPLPAYRSRTGSMDGGNYVARTLLTATRIEYPRGLPPQRRFESGLELLHAQLDAAAIPAGGQTRLTLFWQITRPYPKEALFITRFQNGDLPPINLDHLPIYGWLPPSRWNIGEVIKESIQIDVPKSAPAGTYGLWVQVINPREGNEDPLLPRTEDQPPNVMLAVGDEPAKAELASLQQQAETLLGQSDFEKATVAARHAASIFPDDRGAQALLERCNNAWRDELLRRTEGLMSESARQASETYKPAWWRWPGDPKVVDLGRRLAAEVMTRADALYAEKAWGAAFEHYQAAIVLDPRRSKARQRAESIRMLRDPPRGVPEGQEDREWARGIVVGIGDKGTVTDVRNRFRAGESVICQIYWSNPGWHKTEWMWYDPEGIKRYEQSQPTRENTPMSFAYVDVPRILGTWTVEVRVNGKAIGTRRFEVGE